MAPGSTIRPHQADPGRGRREWEELAQRRFAEEQEAFLLRRREEADKHQGLAEQLRRLEEVMLKARSIDCGTAEGDPDPHLQEKDEEGFRAIDDMTPRSIIMTPLQHVREIPKGFHEPWAGVVSEVLQEVEKAKVAHSPVGIARALKWFMALQDIFLRKGGVERGGSRKMQECR